MTDLPLLELDQVTVRRSRAVLLDRVSLGVERGSLHLLIGPNGAGKSTLIAALLGQIEFSGAIRFHWRREGRIGLVPQNFAIDRSLPLNAGEFLAISRQRWPTCLGIGKHVRARIAALLSRAGLEGFEQRMMGDLSGGELQALLLANAIDPEPELLVLDEPAAALDESAVRRFEAILLALRRASNATVLMVSHDLEQVRRLADRVTILDRTVLRSGTPADVLAATTWSAAVASAIPWQPVGAPRRPP